MIQTSPSFCRICGNACGVLVDVDSDSQLVVGVRGDPLNPLHRGYSCTKGRAVPDVMYSPERLLRPMRRTANGDFEPTSTRAAVEEIAEQLTGIIAEHGPRSVAMYWGTMMLASTALNAVSNAFMDAIGSPMRFTTNTIDKGGQHIALALHGRWMAPRQAFDDPDVALLLGVNPFVSYQAMPLGHPGAWLPKRLEDGMKLIVVDPRRSDIAKRAFLHLQARPGHDASILAAIIRTIIDEDLVDQEFVSQHTSGLDILRAGVEPFAAERVATAADVPLDDLLLAARIFGRARRGYAVAGTGPNMSGHGTLIEYLVLDLEALCGHYLRAGERIRNANTLMPAPVARAQAEPPRPAFGFGERLRVRDLGNTAAGLPTAALADEILLDGPGRVRALISVSGNPVAAFPDKTRTVAAMKNLDLLVQIDPFMSQTAQLAHYVIAPTLQYEVAAHTMYCDVQSTHAPHYGLEDSYAQYTPAIVPPPADADVVEEWDFFHRLGKRMGLPLRIASQLWFDIDGGEIDMSSRPDPDTLLAMVAAGSRIPLEEVKRHLHGAFFPADAVVQEREPGWTGRLDLANAHMMSELAKRVPTAAETDDLSYRLVARRMPQVYNSSYNVPRTNRGRRYNPAFMHSEDLRALGVAAGELVTLINESGSVVAVAMPDDTLRRGLVSLTHCFGSAEVEQEDPWIDGASVNQLVSVDRVYDPFSGQPLMSNVPVAVRPHTAAPPASP